MSSASEASVAGAVTFSTSGSGVGRRGGGAGEGAMAGAGAAAGVWSGAGTGAEAGALALGVGLGLVARARGLRVLPAVAVTAAAVVAVGADAEVLTLLCVLAWPAVPWFLSAVEEMGPSHSPPSSSSSSVEGLGLRVRPFGSRHLALRRGYPGGRLVRFSLTCCHDQRGAFFVCQTVKAKWQSLRTQRPHALQSMLLGFLGSSGFERQRRVCVWRCQHGGKL